MNVSVQKAAPSREPTPMENLCALVGAGAIAFYWAEKDHNPEVRSYWDAVHYIATCLSVGYAKIFPVTPIGEGGPKAARSKSKEQAHRRGGDDGRSGPLGGGARGGKGSSGRAAPFRSFRRQPT